MSLTNNPVTSLGAAAFLIFALLYAIEAWYTPYGFGDEITSTY